MIKTILKKLKKEETPEQKARKQLFSIQLGKEDIVIDCGANIGSVTRHLCKSGAKVYCFEPNPYAFEELKKEFSNMKNVHCISKGVSVENGKAKLYLHENSDADEVYWSTGSSLLNFKGNVLNSKYIEIELIDLCEFIESLNSNIRILKMDVEGVECKIINKIINTDVINKIESVFVETHDHKIPELKEETNAIRTLISQRKIKNINLDWT